MPNNYGDKPPLSYNKYLRVQDLINLQDCLSDPVHHDELLFITVHQAYELWFKQILHELDAAIMLLEEDRVPAATRALKRIVEIEKLLVNQIHILETMTPISFLVFRDQLNPASGFQSMQFRELEFVSGIKDERILRSFESDDFAYERLSQRLNEPTLSDAFWSLLDRSGFDGSSHETRVRSIVEILTQPEKYPDFFLMQDLLIEHDENIALWRYHHVLMVERMLGMKRGTGGSEGAGYLMKTIGIKFFPEIWEARTHLKVAPK